MFLKVICFTALFTASASLSQGQGAAITPRAIISPQFDPRGIQLLERAANTLRYASAVNAVVQMRFRGRNDSVFVRLDSARATSTGYRYVKTVSIPGEGSWDVTLVTPSECLMYDQSGRGRKCDSEKIGSSASLSAFFKNSGKRDLEAGYWGLSRLTDPLVRSVTFAGETSWQGEPYNIVEWVYEQSYTQPKDTIVYTTRVLIDKNHIIRRMTTRNNRNAAETDEQVLSMQLDMPYTEKDFSDMVPKNLTIPPVRFGPKSLVGQRLSEFAAPARFIDGSLATAEEIPGKNKVTLLWFWNTTCTSCIAHMPQLERLYREFKGRGVNIIAVNAVNDSVEKVHAKENLVFNRITMPVIFQADSWNAGLRTTLSAILLDQNGVVLRDGLEHVLEMREALEKYVAP